MVKVKLIFLYLSGGFGVDFSHNIDNVEEGVSKVAKEILKHGVTSFCPTIVTSPAETYRNVLPRIKKAVGSRAGAAILGVHVEGPFISPSKKGAHEEICIRKFEEVRCNSTSIIKRKHCITNFSTNHLK